MIKLFNLSATAALALLAHSVAVAEFYPGRFLLTNPFPDLTFTQPVQLLESPDDTGLLYVVERAGRIRRFDPAAPTSTQTMLDITAQTFTQRDHALMALEFDPDFVTNGHFYVHYSWRPATLPGGLYVAPGRISRFTMDHDTGVADVATEHVILEVEQPFQDHNGGNMEFGPDGMLYIAFGDGGSVTGSVPPPWTPMDGFDPDSQDPYRNAQNTENLLGAILRIDVHGEPDAGLNYAVPTDNPFVEGGPAGELTRPEIFAYGLRNPWRITFHPTGGWLLVGDVGAKGYEEINHVVAGGNYGWSVMEGPDCFRPADPPCTPSDFDAPIFIHPWSSTGFRSVTGGYVWTSPRLPSLNGVYVYADYLAGEIWGLTYDGTTAEAIDIATATNVRVAGMGRDNSGEVYVLNFQTGKVLGLDIDPAAPTPVPTPLPSPSPTATPEPTPTPEPDAGLDEWKTL